MGHCSDINGNSTEFSGVGGCETGIGDVRSWIVPGFDGELRWGISSRPTVVIGGYRHTK